MPSRGRLARVAGENRNMLFKNVTKRDIAVMAVGSPTGNGVTAIVQEYAHAFRNGQPVIRQRTIGVKVPPGATVDIPDEIAMPRRNSNGTRRVSILEELTTCP